MPAPAPDRTPAPDRALRWLAGALGYGLFVVAVFTSLGLLYALAYGASVPDAYAGSDDFWPAPSTWGEVAVRAARPSVSRGSSACSHWRPRSCCDSRSTDRS